ncbi:flagellin [Anaerotignum faecicola]|nr:flagellin [Anaerotignum faecicola]
MRVTTRAIMSNYSRNLNKTMANLDSSRQKVLTKRKFNNIDEDPSAAARSFKLRREFNQNADYLENVKTTISMFDTVSSSALSISGVLNEQVNEDTLSAINGATSYEARLTYAKTLRGMQDSIVLSLNEKYADRFLFGGAGTKEAPFELKDDKLYYRGIDVNTTDPDEIKKLEEMMDETLYVDIGFGMEENAQGDVVGSSAFNTAVPGLNIVGYGQTADGVSKNVVTLLGQMADALEEPNLNEAKFGKLMDQFVESKNDVADFVAELGTKSEFLENRKKQLETASDNINVQIVDVENVDMAAAISDYVWQQYAYNAALKVGTSILSPSFIDFMK